MTITACLPRGGRRVVASALVVAVLGVPAVALAETIDFLGGDGADRFTVGYEAPDRLRVTRDGQEAAARQVASGDVVALDTLGGDDRVALERAQGFAREVRTRLALGDGDDVLSLGLDGVGPFALDLRGGEGDDRVVGDLTSFDRLDADTGRDDDTSVLAIRGDSNALDLDGGAGHDLWALHNYGDTNRVRVDGGSGDDVVSLRTRGKDGRFRIDGGAGEDVARLVAYGSTGVSAVRASLGAGDDRVQGRGAMRALYSGGAGNDDLRHAGGGRSITMNGGAGDDLLVSRSAGDDMLQGRGGDDRIVARGGGRDTVSCGPGNDTVVVDRRDVVAADCERRVGYIDLNDPAKA